MIKPLCAIDKIPTQHVRFINSHRRIVPIYNLTDVDILYFCGTHFFCLFLTKFVNKIKINKTFQNG